MRSLLTRSLALLPLLVAALPAQTRAPLTGADCGNKEGKVCRTKVVTEATFSYRVAEAYDTKGLDQSYYNYAGNHFHYAMSLGFVRPVAPRTGIGGLASVGLREDGLYLLAGVRYRRHLSPTTQLDITPGYMLQREQSIVGPVMLDAAVTFKNTIGISAQVATGTLHHWTPDDPDVTRRRTTVHVGARLGSTAGLFGIGTGVAAGIGVLALILAYGVGS